MTQYNEKLVSLPNILTQLASQATSIPIKLKGVYELATSKPEKEKSIGLLLEKHARQRPEHIAIRYEDVTYTYDQVNRKANQIAHYLTSQGIGSGDVVAVVLENRPETLISVLAIVKLGAIASMINTSQRGEVLLHSLTLVKPKMIIVGEEMLENVNTVEGDLDEASLKSLHYLRDTGETACPEHYTNILTAIEGQSDKNPDSTKKVKMHQPCYYIFTSGTTGLPKASVMSHYRWFKSLAGMGLASMNMSSKDILYVSLPLYHNNALTVSMAAYVCRQLRPVEFFQWYRWRNGCHACAAVGVRDLYAINNSVLNACQFHQDGFNFRCCNVFTFPAEGIPQAVSEGDVFVTLVVDQITGVEPAVVFLEDVTQQFAVGRVFVGVAFKRLLIVYLGDQQTAVSGLHGNHKAFVVTQRRVFFDIVLHDVVRKRAEACRFIEVKGVGEYQIALGCAVEFIDVINVETVLKLHPDVRAQAVTNED